jgi:hypothetical protein
MIQTTPIFSNGLERPFNTKISSKKVHVAQITIQHFMWTKTTFTYLTPISNMDMFFWYVSAPRSLHNALLEMFHSDLNGQR